MRKIITAAIVTGLIGVGGISASLAAHADPPPTSGDTSTTLEVSGGDLSLTAQTGATLTSVAAGQTTTGGSLGTVTVTDMRAGLGVSWTASATSTDFANSTVPGAAAIPVADIKYTPGAKSANSGNVTFTAGTAAATMSSGTGVTAYSASNEIGVASVSWDPAISIALPSDVVAGTYGGTITHSVA